tara:strand:+ start:444 stop:617 length:174 start_codon:yes stop_codon:yes gene_type:complete
VDSKINMVNIGTRLLPPGLENQIETIIDRERLKTKIFRILLLTNRESKKLIISERNK